LGQRPSGKNVLFRIFYLGKLHGKVLVVRLFFNHVMVKLASQTDALANLRAEICMDKVSVDRHEREISVSAALSKPSIISGNNTKPRVTVSTRCNLDPANQSIRSAE
jgi:hypothetical protein